MSLSTLHVKVATPYYITLFSFLCGIYHYLKLSILFAEYIVCFPQLKYKLQGSWLPCSLLPLRIDG